MTRDNPLQKSADMRGNGTPTIAFSGLKSISNGGEDAGLFNQGERFSQDIFHKGFTSTHNDEQQKNQDNALLMESKSLPIAEIGNQIGKSFTKIEKTTEGELKDDTSGGGAENVVAPAAAPTFNNKVLSHLGNRIREGKMLAPGNLFAKTVTEHEHEQNQVSRIFRRYIKKKIEQEYEIYFKKLLSEAKHNYNNQQNDSYNDKANLREVVGLKVGLEFIKQAQVQKQWDDFNQLIDERMKANKLYSMMFNIQESQYFDLFMALSIILNTLTLALDRYPVNLTQTVVLEKVNIVFTLIFLIEMVVKMLALGIKNYFKGSAFNIFDCVIVFASIIDLFFSNFVLNSDNESSGSVVTALRGFRLLRIFKLAKQWKRFELLLETLGRTLQDIATFSILLFLFIFVFALLGLELFAWRAKFNLKTDTVDLVNGVSPMYNFDDFQNSFTTVFIVLTNDAMAQIYYDHYRSVGGLSSTIFFIMLVIIGQKILLNLFLAILLENFDESALKHKMHEYEKDQTEKSSSQNTQIGMQERIMQFIKSQWKKIVVWYKKRNGTYVEELSEEEKKKLQMGLSIFQNKKDMRRGISKQMTIINELIMEGDSLNFISVKSRLRKFLFHIVTDRRFDYFVIVVIIVSAVQLAIDSPLINPDSQFKKTLEWIDLATTIIFIMEAITKIIAFGFIFNGKSSYVKNPWNSLDFTIILFSILALTPLSDTLKTFKIFRILRILRIISRNEELKVAVRALFLAIPNVANVTIIMILFFLIFGVIAVSYFKGKLYYCKDSIDGLEDLIQSKWDCLDTGGDWLNSIYNFDNSVNALVTLFVLSTTAGWADIMYKCATTTNIDYVQSPWGEANLIWIVFFVLFIIVGAFFFLNLFVGVVISTFNSEHDKLGGNDLLTEKQKEWIDLKLLVLRSSPMRKLQKPPTKLRAFFFRIQSSKFFDNLILFCIIANTLILFLKWYEQPKEVDIIAEYINYIFTAIFVFEAVVKLISTDVKVYFSEGWNIFDFVIILGSFLSIFISANTSLEIRGAITILRSFRILRLLRLIKRGKSLQLIFNTFVITLHSLANIGALLLLFIFMYAVLGMILFGTTKRNRVMDDYINFENFYQAFVTLFIVATGDTWNDIMISFANGNHPSSECIVNPSYKDYVAAGRQPVGCGSASLAYAYFVSYMFVVNLIFLKIFIAIILQGYNDTQTQDGRLFNHDMNDRFREVWTDFDPQATTFIKLSMLRDFLFALGEPLGFGSSFEGKKFMQDQFIASLELPTYHNFTSYQYIDVLDALSFRLMVLDHITKNYNSKNGNNGQGGQIDKEQEREIKMSLQKEINKLIFQKQSEHITAVKEVSQKETKRLQNKNQNKDKVLTSSHHMAAEATIRKFKQFINKKTKKDESGNSNEEKDPDLNETPHLGPQSNSRNLHGSNRFTVDGLQVDSVNQLHQLGPIENSGSRSRLSLMKNSKILTPQTSLFVEREEAKEHPQGGIGMLLLDTQTTPTGPIKHGLPVSNNSNNLLPTRFVEFPLKNPLQNRLSEVRSRTQNIIQKSLQYALQANQQSSFVGSKNSSQAIKENVSEIDSQKGKTPPSAQGLGAGGADHSRRGSSAQPSEIQPEHYDGAFPRSMNESENKNENNQGFLMATQERNEQLLEGTGNILLDPRSPMETSARQLRDEDELSD